MDRVMRGIEAAPITRGRNRRRPPHTWYFPESKAARRTHKKIGEVKGEFIEILEPLEQKAAAGESERCMSCGLCFSCRQCMLYCPQEAIRMFKENPVGQVMYTDYTKCVGCHICAETCPTGYIDMGMGDDL